MIQYLFNLFIKTRRSNKSVVLHTTVLRYWSLKKDFWDVIPPSTLDTHSLRQRFCCVTCRWCNAVAKWLTVCSSRSVIWGYDGLFTSQLGSTVGGCAVMAVYIEWIWMKPIFCPGFPYCCWGSVLLRYIWLSFYCPGLSGGMKCSGCPHEIKEEKQESKISKESHHEVL